MKIIIARHGESQANLSRHFEASGNASGSPLTQRGKAQARLLATHLSDSFPVSCIYSSPTRRTQETAIILKEKIDAPLVIVDELREIDCGSWGNKPVDIVKENYPEEWKKRKQKPVDFCFPQGESLMDLEARIIPFIDKLLKTATQQTIVLVSHSAMISVSLAYLFDWQMEEAWLDRRSYHANAAFSILEFDVSTMTIISSSIAGTTHLQTD